MFFGHILNVFVLPKKEKSSQVATEIPPSSESQDWIDNLFPTILSNQISPFAYIKKPVKVLAHQPIYSR